MLPVQDAGTGDLLQLRATDADVVKCRHRYSIFRVRSSGLVCRSVSSKSDLATNHVSNRQSAADGNPCSCADHVSSSWH